MDIDSKSATPEWRTKQGKQSYWIIAYVSSCFTAPIVTTYKAFIRTHIDYGDIIYDQRL